MIVQAQHVEPPPLNPCAKKPKTTGSVEERWGTPDGTAASLEALPIGAMNTPNTADGLRSAIKYIDKFFAHRRVRRIRDSTDASGTEIRGLGDNAQKVFIEVAKKKSDVEQEE